MFARFFFRQCLLGQDLGPKAPGAQVGQFSRGLWLAASVALPMSAVAELTVVDAWVAEPPPVAVPAAGYVSLHNAGDSQEVVISLRGEGFERVELHRSEVRDGVASMTPVPSLKVAPGQTVKMGPGGLHVMLFGSARTLAAGDEVELVMITASGDELVVRAPVRRSHTVSMDHSGHMDHTDHSGHMEHSEHSDHAGHAEHDDPTSHSGHMDHSDHMEHSDDMDDMDDIDDIDDM